MDFTTYENSVYGDVQKDEMLRSFFEKLTVHSEHFYHKETEKQIKEKDIEEPTLDKIFEIISKLKNENINVNSDMKLILKYTQEIFFQYHLFDNDMQIRDLEFIKDKIKFGFDKYSKLSPAEEECEEFKINHKGFAKKYRKIEKKIKGDKKNSRSLLTKSEIWNFYRLEDLEKRVEFIKSLTECQAKLLIELYDAIGDYNTKYSEYNDEVIKRDEDIKKLGLIYEEAFKHMLDISLTGIDIDSITLSLFKILVINKLENKEANIEKISFESSIVDWYIKYKNDDLNELYDQIFKDFGLVINKHIEKKKIKGGIN